MKQIILVGGPASGKTTVGKQLAAKWKVPFFDTDQWVEAKAGQAITQIFATQGEAVFRAFEKQALKALLQQDDCIIATGGGLIESAGNRLLLVTRRVVYLDVSINTQLLRTAGDKARPLLQVLDKEKKLRELYERRDSLYRSVATLIAPADLHLPSLIKYLDTALQKI